MRGVCQRGDVPRMTLNLHQSDLSDWQSRRRVFQEGDLVPDPMLDHPHQSSNAPEHEAHWNLGQRKGLSNSRPPDCAKVVIAQEASGFQSLQ